MHIKAEAFFGNGFYEGTWEEVREKLKCDLHREYFIIKLPNKETIHGDDFIKQFDELVKKFPDKTEGMNLN